VREAVVYNQLVEFTVNFENGAAKLK